MKHPSKHPAPKSATAPKKDAKGGAPRVAPTSGGAPTLSARIDALRALDLDGLRREFLAVLGRPTNSKDREAMITRISEGLVFSANRGPGRPVGKPAQPEGTAPAAPSKAAAPVRASSRKSPASPFTQDPRLPAPGSTISVEHKGTQHTCRFLGAEGFEYEGARYRSLSAIAKKVLGGVAVNGFCWWGLTGRPNAPTARKAATPAKARPAARSRAKAK